MAKRARSFDVILVAASFLRRPGPMRFVTSSLKSNQFETFGFCALPAWDGACL